MIQTEMYRLRALQSEQRARSASDPLVRAEWEALAIEWHALASAAVQGPDDFEQIEIV
jgi:hypothetical protein